MAQSINANQIKTSGWLDLPLNTSRAAAYANSTPRIMKSGNVVNIVGAMSPLDATAVNEVNSQAGSIMATIPEGFRPPMGMNILCQGSSGNVWLAQINSETGALTASRYRSVLTGTWGGGNHIYMANI